MVAKCKLIIAHSHVKWRGLHRLKTAKRQHLRRGKINKRIPFFTPFGTLLAARGFSSSFSTSFGSELKRHYHMPFLSPWTTRHTEKGGQKSPSDGLQKNTEWIFSVLGFVLTFPHRQWMGGCGRFSWGKFCTTRTEKGTKTVRVAVLLFARFDCFFLPSHNPNNNAQF